jgi:hypothetical protein
MNLLGLGREDDDLPISGSAYILKLHKFIKVNLNRFAPPNKAPSSTILGQSYTLLTLGLDPSSQPLSSNVKIPLTLGFGSPQSSARPTPPKPLTLRLPPDRLLYLLLRWQSLPQSLTHVGRTDVPIAPGVTVSARGARADGRDRKLEGDVQSVRSWAGSIRSVSMGSLAPGRTFSRSGWFGKPDEMTEGQRPADCKNHH